MCQRAADTIEEDRYILKSLQIAGGSTESTDHVDPPHPLEAEVNRSLAKVDEVASLIRQALGYQTQCYWFPQLSKTGVLDVLDRVHVIHANLALNENGHRKVQREEHWLLRLPPENEADVPEYVWRIVDLLVAHNLRPFWFWTAERVPVDDQPIIDPRPLYCFSFDGRHVIAL